MRVFTGEVCQENREHAELRLFKHFFLLCDLNVLLIADLGHFHKWPQFLTGQLTLGQEFRDANLLQKKIP